MAEGRQSTSTGSKRRRTVGATPVPRKRARTSEPHARTAPRQRNSRQSTLTQIEFVKSSSFSSIEDDVAHFKPIEEPAAPVEEGTTRTLRDSTLTQLDFITTDPKIESSIAEDVILSEGPRSVRRAQTRIDRTLVTKRESTLTQMDYFQNTDTTPMIYLNEEERIFRLPAELQKPRLPTVQTFDGAHECEALPTLENESMPPPAKRSSRKKPRNSQLNSQDYVPTQIIERARATDPDFANKRRSRRQKVPGGEPIRPPLLVQDTTDFDTQDFLLQQTAIPSTPAKSKDRVLSSQSPESIARSTRQRKPLGELSVNLQQSPLKSAKKAKLQSFRGHVKRDSPRKSKICILKVPLKAFLPRGNKDDSQADTWSLQPTSSPKKSNPSKRKDVQPEALTFSEVEGKGRKWEPEIASDPPQISAKLVDNNDKNDSQQSLPDLSDIFRDLKPRAKTTKAWHTLPPSDSSNTRIQQKNLESPAHPANLVPELNSSDIEDGSDFGTPVRNDTQFVSELVQRVSSPRAASELTTEELDATDHNAKAGVTEAVILQDAPHLAHDDLDIIVSPLRTPRLVPSPIRQLSKVSTKSTMTTSSTVGKSQAKTSQVVRTTQVPLNDTEDLQDKSSSSPKLPPLLSNDTQRSVRPASMPHQSQISTQAVSTQGLALTPTGGTLPAYRTQDDGSVEKILIRDSSSSFRKRVDRMQPKGLEDEVEDDFADDVNLDPYTLPLELQAAESARPNHGNNDVTQTPTQKSRRSTLKRRATTQDSPVVLQATTRSQRDARLEVITLLSSSQVQQQSRPASKVPYAPSLLPYSKFAPVPASPSSTTAVDDQPQADLANDIDHDIMEDPPPSSIPTSELSPSPPRTLKRKYSPIPGFDNDTQSDFTQNGHITAAYIHRGREEGWLPEGYTPKPYKAKHWQAGSGRSTKKTRVVK